MHSQSDLEYKLITSKALTLAIADVLLEENNNKAITETVRFRDKELPKILHELAIFKDENKNDAIEMLYKIKQNCEVWLDRNKRSEDKSITTYVTHIAKSNSATLQEKVLSSLYRLTTTALTLNKYDNPKVFEEFLRAISKDKTQKPLDSKVMQDYLSQIKVDSRTPDAPVVEGKNTVNLSYLHPKIELEDLQENPNDITKARLKDDVVKEKIEHNGSVYSMYSKGVLGKGGFGEVCLAQNDQTGEWIALKKILKSSSAAINEEVNKLNQNNQYVFHTKKGSVNYIGMQLQKGEELRVIMSDTRDNKRAPLSVMQLLYICKNIMRTAADLHNAKDAIVDPNKAAMVPKMIHRDIKPANMMMDSSLNVKFIDFGMAADIKEKNTGIEIDKIKGTQVFMAPEILDGVGRYNEKSEVYALGVSLLTIVSGYQYIDTDTQEAFRPFYGSGGKLRELYQLIREMMSSKPEERPTVTEAYSALNAINNKFVSRNPDALKDLLVFSVNLERIKSLFTNGNLDKFAEKLKSTGANSIAITAESFASINQKELIQLQRAFQKVGIQHIAPEVYVAKNDKARKELVTGYYAAKFGSAEVVIHPSKEFSDKLVDKPKDTDKKVNASSSTMKHSTLFKEKPKEVKWVRAEVSPNAKKWKA